jgi:hypothetical protein
MLVRGLHPTWPARTDALSATLGAPQRRRRAEGLDDGELMDGLRIEEGYIKILFYVC